MLVIKDVYKAYDHSHALRGVSCMVHPGEILGILGPNGSGKSTLLRAISGVEPADSGEVVIGGHSLKQLSRKQLARRMAVLEQEALPPLGFTVREILEMGRYPHEDWLGREPVDPEPLIGSVMERLGLAPLADRSMDQLSGGERQRTALGKAMVQEPSILLLDEPTTYLDIGYQIQMMDYVRKWSREKQLTVVAVLHDLNLAAQYCDRLLVMKNGQVASEGEPWAVLKAELIESVYGTKPVVVNHPTLGVPQILLQPHYTDRSNSIGIIHHSQENRREPVR